MPKWPLNPQKQPALLSPRAGHMDPESKKTAWRQATQREKGVSPQGDGNRKPEDLKVLHLNTPFCITIVQCCSERTCFGVLQQKGVLAPRDLESAVMRDVGELSAILGRCQNLRKLLLLQCMLHPFVVLRQFGFLAFCNGSSLETSHCGFQDCTANNPYMLEHLEPCPNKLRCGAYIHHKSFCSQPYFQCVQSYTSKAIVLFIHSHDELFQESATIYAKHHDAILCCFRMMPCFVGSFRGRWGCDAYCAKLYTLSDSLVQWKFMVPRRWWT